MYILGTGTLGNVQILPLAFITFTKWGGHWSGKSQGNLTSRPITTKFYLKHHWGGGKAALGFDADQIRTLDSMATDSSYRVIMGKRASSRFLDCF